MKRTSWDAILTLAVAILTMDILTTTIYGCYMVAGAAAILTTMVAGVAAAAAGAAGRSGLGRVHAARAAPW